MNRLSKPDSCADRFLADTSEKDRVNRYNVNRYNVNHYQPYRSLDHGTAVRRRDLRKRKDKQANSALE